MGNRKKKNRAWKKIAGAHLRISVWMFVTYLVLSVAYSPDFLLSDIRHKWSALADDTITITAKVLGPPKKPVVSGNPVCESGSLSVTLDWADDENTTTFDVLRDGSPLVSGLAVSAFIDSNVVVGTTYVYEVIANGPMGPGVAMSDPMSATTPGECVVHFVPSLDIVSFDGKAISGSVGTPETENRKPIISGMTNIASAQVDLLVVGGPVSVSARVLANGNGYFSWRPPYDLAYGTLTVFVTASDPSDQSLTASKNLLFKIDEKKEEKHSGSRGTTSINPVQPGSSDGSGLVQCSVPLDFLLHTGSADIYQGRELPYLVEIGRVDSAYEGTEADATYQVVDKDGKIVLSSIGTVTLRKGNVVSASMAIPSYLRNGKYSLRAILRFGSFDVGREVSFTLLPLPVLDFGGGLRVTYAQLLSELGTISLLLLLLLLLWASLFAQEYFMFLESARRITERNLIRAGFFGQKKGKGVSG
ncbi:MAG TPA: hypothetical protein VN420_05120 [Candidatus Fimivivens sp.]|nr:hypothetical protein [Candidatus Fimivivens sp.]